MLLSKTLKNALDLNNDKGIVFDEEVELYQSTKANYCIDIYPSNDFSVQYVLGLEKHLTSQEPENQILKIHK